MHRVLRDPMTNRCSNSYWRTSPLVFAFAVALTCQLPGQGDSAADGDGGDETSQQNTQGPTRLPGGTESRPVTRADVLDSVAHQVVVPATETFAQAAHALAEATARYATAQGTGPAEAELAQARAAWTTAMSAWQHLEVMQFGPAASEGTTVAGEGIRDEIYSWPTSNPCRVDLKVSQAAAPASDYFEANSVDSYGLDAVEALLFAASSDHRCPDDVGLDPVWTGLGTTEVEHRRAVYAQAMAAEVARQADVLVARWRPAAEDFAGTLAAAGTTNSPFASEAEALDEVFAGMFYVDKFTKDAKLGRSLGIIAGCVSVPCVDLLEHAHHREATATSLAANLMALRSLVLGGSSPLAGRGFDDLLRQEGHADIADTLLSEIDNALALLQSVTTPVADVVAANPAQGQALYDAIKRVTDVLKGPFVMALRLTIPAEGAGDND